MSGLLLPEPDQSLLDKREEIVLALENMLPAGSVISSENARRAYDADALTAYKQLPLVVVLPQTTQEVSLILAYCHKNGIPVVARGAGTSLAGGALPAADGIVLGVSRMSKVLEVDFDNRFMRVEAGVTNLNISNHVEADGFFYAPDPSSQLACTIAGNIAMNSGGAHCLKYGVTTNNLLGVRIVLIDGTIVDIGGGHLDAPGLDLLGLVTGSEGQLGIVTEATVRILAKSEGAKPVLFGFQSASAAGHCVAAIIGAGIIPVAIEYMDRPAIRVCEAYAKAGYPLDVEALLIIEVEGSDPEIDYLIDRIVEIAADHDPAVIKVSQSEAESAAIWKGRKSAFGAMGRIADYMCMDGTIPTGQLPDVLEGISRICEKYGLQVANIFHAGDGNLHPLILYNANDPDELRKAEQCGAEVLELCVEVGGCLTGEHGVGIEKRDLMTSQFNAVDLAQQMSIKSALDPQWLLNPGKVFPLNGRPARAKKPVPLQRHEHEGAEI
ncbi:MAG: FAD-binding protein [Cohaesibacteraceae bacterium]|nr:FAD-binding protein [Cohaesibacteraceae bacterium]MBL4874980.1 FAD-binding protein [Cohaesibacteraceae bacterium]